MRSAGAMVPTAEQKALLVQQRGGTASCATSCSTRRPQWAAVVYYSMPLYTTGGAVLLHETRFRWPQVGFEALRSPETVLCTWGGGYGLRLDEAPFSTCLRGTVPFVRGPL